jgi:hypothetical protein
MVLPSEHHGHEGVACKVGGNFRAFALYRSRDTMILSLSMIPFLGMSRYLYTKADADLPQNSVRGGDTNCRGSNQRRQDGLGLWNEHRPAVGRASSTMTRGNWNSAIEIGLLKSIVEIFSQLDNAI